MRQEDPAAFGVKVGDVLLGHEGTPQAPSGEMFYHGVWEKVSIEAFAAFLVLSVDNEDEHVHVELVSLISAVRIEMVLYRAALGDRITLVRGGRVVPAEECGTVGS